MNFMLYALCKRLFEKLELIEVYNFASFMVPSDQFFYLGFLICACED